MTAEERLTDLEAWRREFAPAQSRRNEDVEQRLRAVERTIWKAAGFVIALNAAVAVGLKILFH